MRTGDGVATAARNAALLRATPVGRFLVVALIAVASLAALRTADAMAADPVIAAAGDIACSSSSSTTTAAGRRQAAARRPPRTCSSTPGSSAVLALGDAQYQSGKLSELQQVLRPDAGDA